MKLKTDSLNELLFRGICLCIFLFPINYKLIGFLRPVDVLVIILFCLFIFTNPKLPKLQFLIILLIAFTLLISTLIGYSINGYLQLEKLVFVYKYLLIFSLPWIFLSVIKTKKQIYIINKFLFFIFILLCIWSYLSNYFYIDRYIRSSFPSINTHAIDSHLFSAYLSFFFGVYLFYYKKFFNHNLLLSTLISVNYFFGVLATGSRTGILLLLIILLTFCILQLFNFLKFICAFNFIRKKKKILKIIISITLLFLFTKIILYFTADFFEINKYLIDRAFNFNYFENENGQISQRVKKLYIALNEISYSGWIIGNGLSSKLVFYDGIFSLLIAHGGLSLVLLIMIFYFSLLKKKSINLFNQYFLFFFSLCIISNLITEYIMITRYAFPILLVISIFYKNLLAKKSKHESIYNYRNI